MSDVTTTPANISADWNRGSIVEPYLANVELTVGDVVYIDSNGKLNKADADVAILNSRSLGIVVTGPNLYGETTIAAGQYAAVCIFGPVYGLSATMPTSQVGYVSKTAGKLDDTAPTGGAFQYVVGHWINTDTFFVEPGQGAPASV